MPIDKKPEQLNNKKLETPTIASPTITGTASGGTFTGATLTTPTLTSPVINTGVSGTAFLDDDTMATATATTFSSAESIKAYIDAQIATVGEIVLTSGTHSAAASFDIDISGYTAYGELRLILRKGTVSTDGADIAVVGSIDGSTFEDDGAVGTWRFAMGGYDDSGTGQNSNSGASNIGIVHTTCGNQSTEVWRADVVISNWTDTDHPVLLTSLGNSTDGSSNHYTFNSAAQWSTNDDFTDIRVQTNGGNFACTWVLYGRRFS